MIALCSNPFRDEQLNICLKAADILNKAGYECAVCPVFYEDEPDIVPQNVKTHSILEIIDKCSLLIVIGGDGTILSVARTIHGHNVPILGVNLGTKGFMTALEPDELEYILKAAAGEMKISRRMKLDVEIYREGELVYTDCALNDAVIHGYGDCVKLTAWCDGTMITSYSGDGIILATPTGSTGYSLSAGGPIVEPDAENIILNQICAHAIGARPFVLDPSRRVKVRTEKLHGRRAYLSVDGNNVFDLANGDELVVKRSQHSTFMLDSGLRSFFEIAFEKLR